MSAAEAEHRCSTAAEAASLLTVLFGIYAQTKSSGDWNNKCLFKKTDGDAGWQIWYDDVLALFKLTTFDDPAEVVAVANVNLYNDKVTEAQTCVLHSNVAFEEPHVGETNVDCVANSVVRTNRPLHPCCITFI